MSRTPLTASPGTTFKELAALLLGENLSAVPVVDTAGHLVGIVSEADLVHHVSALSPAGGRASSPARTEAACTARALMSAPVVTARPDWSLQETGRTMERMRLKRLPVLDRAERLIGVVSRSDLLLPFLRRDEDIAADVKAVVEGAMGLPEGSVHATVHNGVVYLTGMVQERADLPVLDRLCRRVDGVVTVRGSIRCMYDNRSLDVEPPHGHEARGAVMKRVRSVADVMTHAVITVDGDTPFRRIAETMEQWHVSALPVLSEEGRVVGVVSEADLLLKAEGGDEARAVRARELMTRPAVTVPSGASIAEAARLMARGHLKRLPVVDDGRLVGMVSRGDLLKVWLRPEEDLAAEVRLVLVSADALDVRAGVVDGTVVLSGTAPPAYPADVLVRLIRAVPGVVDVDSRLTAARPDA
ncbi:CBS domain-containing protein [Streptomyces zhihengii]|uniref:CBS domain-containing protein n=1 Tax=Streptomyces zhihengii TaxID=1818004 RepID=UPI0034530E4B